MPALRPRAVRADLPRPGRKMVAAGGEDTVLTAIIKWIPVEVIAAYEFILGIISRANMNVTVWLSIAFVPITFLWIAFATKDDSSERNNPIAWRQCVLSAVACAIWIAGTQPEIFKVLRESWQPPMGSAVLGIGAILLPILDGILKRLGVTQG